MDDSIIGLFLLIFCTSIAALILWKLFDITRNSIKKNKPSYDEDRFDKLAKAFIRHRKKTDRRLENIETILTEDKEAHNQRNLQQNTQTIEASGFNHNQRQNTTNSENKQRAT